ncbi:hypothetical protein DFH28DRAFT_922254 [Melampsora americana]|nr:hypothetical protein DFH28DRAFT_922254 [Melampsora americana]
MATADLDTDESKNEDNQRQAIIELWACDHSDLFAPPLHPSSNASKYNNISHRSMYNDSGSEVEDDQSPPYNEDDHKEIIVGENNSSWAPFSSLEQMVALFLLGSSRTTMTVTEYKQIRFYVGLLKLQLPGYQSLQNCRTKLKENCGYDVSESLSPLDKPCFGLQELADPYVMDHLQFMPELPTSTTKVNCLAQSQKWQEELDKDLCVQMVTSPKGQFYLSKPMELLSKKIVIPIFFHQEGDEIFAKCVSTVLNYQEVVNNGGPQIRVEFQLVSDFNSNSLASVNVRSFFKGFEKIKIRKDDLIKNHCGDKMYENVKGTFVEVLLENPWRQKARGKISCHVPLVLYCDDLSGNILKKWNKHIAFYFTLAGLPPKLSNQEYNCHFLTTSNTAGALELAGPVIDEINELGTKGFVVYDHLAKAEVLVVPFVLCHLADSPMHMEVTNTMNPSVSLTPCRICDLKVETLMDKRSARYISNFVGIDEDGSKTSLPVRNWSETQELTRHLWELAQRPGTIGLFESESGLLGIWDTLNITFVKQVQDLHRDLTKSKEVVAKLFKDLNEALKDNLFNPFIRLKGFDGHCDTLVEILHVMLLGVAKYLLRNQMQQCSAKEKTEIWGRWRLFNTSGLKIPAIQPKTMITHFLSLTGKDFCTVLQAALFTVYQCQMTTEERNTWKSLTTLAPYVFQTKITDVKKYINKLKLHIDCFLKSIVTLLAQWCNKPKFHMMVHLCHSMYSFGPPCLFATENFEDYNGNTRNSSIHSNDLSPGRDIANSSNNHRLVRSITSGALNYHKTLKTYIRASKNVTNVFKNNVLFQKAMGYDSSWNQPGQFKPGNIHICQPNNPQACIPSVVFDAYNSREWNVLTSITLENEQQVAENDFVSAKLTSASTGRIIGRVKRIWAVDHFGPTKCKTELTKCKTGGVSGFYGIQEIKATQDIVWITAAVSNTPGNSFMLSQESKTDTSKTRTSRVY